MPGPAPNPPRRRIDLMRLPAPARYALALVTVAIVVGIVLLARGGAGGEPAGWYQVTVTVGAVLLLVWLVVWSVLAGVRRLLRRR